MKSWTPCAAVGQLSGPVTAILSCIIFHSLNKLSLSLQSARHTLSLACFHTLSSTHIKTRKHSHRYCESQRDEHDYTNIRNNHTELPRALKSKDEDDFTDSAGVIGDSLTQTDTSMQVMHHQMEK